MASFKNENIAALFDVYQDDTWLYVVQEYHGTEWHSRTGPAAGRNSWGRNNLAAYLEQPRFMA